MLIRLLLSNHSFAHGGIDLKATIISVTLLTMNLFQVFHGGSVLDPDLDISDRKSDVTTFRGAFEAIMRTHYPSLMGHVLIKCVPCPPICSEALAVLSNLSPYRFLNYINWKSSLDHGIWLEIWGVRGSNPSGWVDLWHLWQPLAPGCHKMHKKMISGQDLKVSEMISFARHSREIKYLALMSTQRMVMILEYQMIAFLLELSQYWQLHHLIMNQMWIRWIIFKVNKNVKI